MLGLSLLAPSIWPLAASPAHAQTRRPAAEVAASKAVPAPQGAALVVVSLSRQRIQVYGSSGLLAQSPVSTGMAGHRTPAGVFAVLQKRRYHESNIYSGAPMPYMQRLTWSGIALHAGVLPGYPASHGCIRMPYGFATQLWGMTKVGARVVVAPDDPAAHPIEDARLPVPRLMPATEPESVARAGAELASAAERTVTDAVGAGQTSRMVTPLARARALRAAATADAASKAKAARLAADIAKAKAAEARSAAASLLAAETAVARALRRYEVAARMAAAAREGAAERAKAALASAESDLATSQAMAEQAGVLDALQRAEATKAAADAVEAENLQRQAAGAAKAAERAVEPVTILVSRKAGKVYIRQGWTPIHEAPVAFSNGPALGTHVYVAVAPGPDEESMRWLAVSLPPAASAQPPSRGKAHESGHGAAETAASVLRRFELPEATRQLIEDRLWAGASLIVSDQGISHETGPGTDLIVLAR